MVEFGRIHRVECSEFDRGKVAPSGTKLLQVSVQTRKELRHKLSEYFGRVPKEDVALLELHNEAPKSEKRWSK